MLSDYERPLSPFYPVLDESLHSYILRLTLITEANDLSSVINSREGSWANLLRIPPQIKRYIKSVRRYDLFTTIKNSFPSSSFYFPIEAIQKTYHELRFDSKTYSKKRDMPIHFCEECFKDQLAKLGFTYFHYYWSFQNSCTIHHTPLSRLTPTTPKRAKRYMKQALALNFNENTIPVDSRNSLVDSSEGSGSGSGSDAEVVFAPCIDSAARKSLWMNQVFPDEYSEMIDYQGCSGGDIELVRKLNYEKEFLPYWNSQIKSCRAEQVQKFTKHLFKSLEPVSEKHPYIDNFYKLRSAHCEGCQHYCPSSNRIPIWIEGCRPQLPKSTHCVFCDPRLANLLDRIDRSNNKIIKKSTRERRREEMTRPDFMERIRKLM